MKALSPILGSQSVSGKETRGAPGARFNITVQKADLWIGMTFNGWGKNNHKLSGLNTVV